MYHDCSPNHFGSARAVLLAFSFMLTATGAQKELGVGR
jgi:hypothetical protein